MASISIYERDLTVQANAEESENVVFVPGFAIQGPANEPTLCRTLDEFQELFGKVPYEFETSEQEETYAPAVVAGTYEKSYLYAAELLRNGLPVLYYRYVDTSLDSNEQPKNAKAKLDVTVDTDKTLTITAKYYGAYGNEFKISSVPQTGTYLSEIQIIDKNSVILSDFFISFNPKDTEHYFKNIQNKYIDMSSDNAISTTAQLTLTATNLANGKTSFTQSSLYSHFPLLFGNNSILLDKDTYNIYYISSGSYPILKYISNDENNNPVWNVKDFTLIAATRGDCTALIDSIDESAETTLAYIQNINFGQVSKNGELEEVSKYGACFTPWAKYELKTQSNNLLDLPGSFGFLYALSESVKSNPNWNAVSGVARGLLTNLVSLNQTITGATADALQKHKGVSINPILMIRPYGYTIWGNRTLMNNLIDLSASSFLNIRSLTNDLKKVIYTTAKSLTFEPNTEVLWLNFKSMVEPTLDQMVSGNGIRGYKFIRVNTTKKATVSCIVRIIPIEAVEDWDITVELNDSTVSVL